MNIEFKEIEPLKIKHKKSWCEEHYIGNFIIEISGNKFRVVLVLNPQNRVLVEYTIHDDKNIGSIKTYVEEAGRILGLDVTIDLSKNKELFLKQVSEMISESKN